MNSEMLTIINIIGVISFATSGALVGIRKKMDYLGVCILGIITSVGGGATRDIIIGKLPPDMFRNPIYVSVAFIVSNIVFFFMFFRFDRKSNPKVNHLFEEALFWFDTFGLASFTVNGVIIGETVTDGSLFLCVFLGVITGVGGSVLRDLLANEVPAIFVKHVYAVASIVGALVSCLLWNVTTHYIAAVTGMALIVLIRFLAMHYRWNFPAIK